jgi:hypothetical protein
MRLNTLIVRRRSLCFLHGILFYMALLLLNDAFIQLVQFMLLQSVCHMISVLRTLSTFVKQ